MSMVVMTCVTKPGSVLEFSNSVVTHTFPEPYRLTMQKIRQGH